MTIHVTNANNSSLFNNPQERNPYKYIISFSAHAKTTNLVASFIEILEILIMFFNKL